jgi:hypothetical protein
MSLENGQQLITTGSVLHLARIDPTTGIVGPARDVGTVQVLNPNVSSTSIRLFDSRGGKRVLIAERNTEFSETYEITCSNITPENLALLFGASSVSEYTQAATPLTGIDHTVYPNSVVHLHDASGNYMYDIASIQQVKVGGTTLTAGTDYIVDANNLKMGFFKMNAPASVTAGGVMADIDFTPNAITGKRTFNPQTAGVASCEAWVYWTADGYDTLYLRDHLTVNINPASPELRDADFSSIKFNLSVVSNSATPARPAGRFVMPKGGLPPFTF